MFEWKWWQGIDAAVEAGKWRMRMGRLKDSYDKSKLVARRNER